MREKFIKILIKLYKRHCPYVWGGQGQNANKLTENEIKAMETSEKNANRVIQFVKMLVAYKLMTKLTKIFDCSGLVCYALYKCGKESKDFDIRADDLWKKYKWCKEVTPGNLIHRSGHIAVYIGYNHLIEAKGRDYGVVISPYDPKEWDEGSVNPFE